MRRLQLLAFSVAGFCLTAWLSSNLGLETGNPSSLLWAAIISFAIGFGALIFEYAKAVVAEDAENG